MYEQFQKLRAELKDYFKERGEVVDGALTALLAKQHLLLVGPPGTAKTNLVETLCTSIKGAKYFFHLLTKFTTDKDLLVSEVMVEEEMDQKGKLIRFVNRSEKKLPQAHIAFLDEIFKCSAVTLNALLRLIHERKCTINPGEEIDSPLITLIGASNELPGKDQEELMGLNDRFLLRYMVDYLSINNNENSPFVSMISNEVLKPQTTITLDDLCGFQEEVVKIKIPPIIYKIINNIRSDLKTNHNIQPSDRRYKESVKAIKAYAYLNHHFEEVEPDDLCILENIYWQTKNQMEKENIQKIIYKSIGSKEVMRVAEIYKQASKIYNDTVRSIEIHLQKDIGHVKDFKEFEILRNKLKGIEKDLNNLLFEPRELFENCSNNAGKNIIETYIKKMEVMPQKLLSKFSATAYREFWGEKNLSE
ncbi:MAG: AAA family ATPase [bacterium]